MRSWRLSRGSRGVSRDSGADSRETRERISARLVELDRMMLNRLARTDASALDAMRAEATSSSRRFAIACGDAYQRAIESAVDRLIREREQLPTVIFE